jgi:hypothetical protein
MMYTQYILLQTQSALLSATSPVAFVPDVRSCCAHLYGVEAWLRPVLRGAC